jgi:hypothetical protein
LRVEGSTKRVSLRVEGSTKRVSLRVEGSTKRVSLRVEGSTKRHRGQDLEGQAMNPFGCLSPLTLRVW